MSTRTKTDPETTIAVGTSAPWYELALISDFNRNRTERVVHLSRSTEKLQASVIELLPGQEVIWEVRDDVHVYAIVPVDRSKRYVIRPAKPGFVLE